MRAVTQRQLRLGACLLLLASILLLSKCTSDHGVGQDSTNHQLPFDSHSELSTGDIVQPFNSQEHKVDHLLPSTDLVHTKRALPAEYHNQVCKGEDYYDFAIKPAFQRGGHSQWPAPVFPDNVFADSGWTFNVDSGEEDPPPADWLDILGSIPGGRPSNGDTVAVYMDHHQRYKSEQGEENVVRESPENYTHLMSTLEALLTDGRVLHWPNTMDS